jgi:hypothetical protein
MEPADLMFGFAGTLPAMSAVTPRRVRQETPAVVVMAAVVGASAAVGLGFGYLLLRGLPTRGDVLWPPYLLVLPLLGVGSYAAVFCATVVCNAVVMAIGFERVAGRPATAADGFRLSLACLPALLRWSTLSLVMGVVIQVEADRVAFGGPVVRWVLALAWAVGTFLVVPVVVVERAWVVAGLRRGAAIVRRRWHMADIASLRAGACAVVVVLMSVVGVVTQDRETQGRAALAVAVAVVVLFTELSRRHP